MRLLMVGPWHEIAMRRHIDWALEAGIEVCAADFYAYEARHQPYGFATASLLPGAPAWQRRQFPHWQSERVQAIAALRLQRLLERFRPDIVHSYKLTPYTEVCLRAGARPLVVSVWSQLSALLTERRLKERRWLRRLRYNAATILVENPNLAMLLARWPGPPLPVSCIPLGIDSTLFHPGYAEAAAGWRFMLAIPDDAQVVFSPRGWSAIYGQMAILEAFAAVYTQRQTPMVLLFLGLGRMKKPQKLAQQVVERAHELGVAHALRWIEKVPYSEMPALYALADVVVNYPSTDTFPSTLLEAIACGCPVISSDLSAYRGTYIERTCRLVQACNPPALAGALSELIENHGALSVSRAEIISNIDTVLLQQSNNKHELIALYQKLLI